MDRSGRLLRVGAALACMLTYATILVSMTDTVVAAPPTGVPDAAEAATVVGYVDGDKFTVKVDGEREEVLLAGVDAPERGECFFGESAKRLKDLLPNGVTVYLEQSGDNRDGKDRLLRYVWIPGEDGAKASMLNTKLVREGFAGFDDRKDNPKYFDRLKELEQDARADDRGVWGTCGGLHRDVPTPVPPTPTPRPPKPTPTPQAVQQAPIGITSGCDSSYPDFCIPPISQAGDLDCPDIGGSWFTVLPPDPHGFDRDQDGIGCES